jgi:NAD(P)H-dependent FMN reductase
MRVLAIAGSYRNGGVIDQAVDVAVRAATKAGAEVDVVHLRDYPIGFCRNCRECTQAPGEAPGECVQDDAMRGLVQRIEAADAFILASPTNVYATTALFRRFMERLLVYADWPWGARAPRLRNKTPTKRALVIASAAAPPVIARMFFSTMKELKATARTIGAARVRDVFIGLAANQREPQLVPRAARRIERATRALI